MIRVDDVLGKVFTKNGDDFQVLAVNDGRVRIVHDKPGQPRLWMPATVFAAWYREGLIVEANRAPFA